MYWKWKNKPIIQCDDIESRDVVLILMTLAANANVVWTQMEIQLLILM